MVFGTRAGRVWPVLGAAVLCAALSIAFMPGNASAVSATGTTTISLGNVTTTGVVVDPSTGTAYVSGYCHSACPSETSVFAIDLDSGTLTATIPLSGRPNGIALDPATHKVYVANWRQDIVTVIDGVTGKVTGAITLPGTAAGGLAVDTATGVVYAGETGASGDGIAVIDGTTNALTTTIQDGCGPPGALADNPATDTLYAECQGDPEILVIDGAANSIATTIAVGGSAGGLAVDPATGTFYAEDVTGGTVSAYDGGTDARIGTVSIGGADGPLAVNPVTHTVYADVISGLDSVIKLINSTSTAVTGQMSEASFGFVAVDPGTSTLVYAGGYPTASVELIPLRAPAITSSSSARIIFGHRFAFTAAGTPTPVITAQGKLPSGAEIIEGSLDWMAKASPASAGGVYRLTITASNGVAPDASQAFTLTVDVPPAFTSANHAAFTHGRRGTFTIRTAGFPTATVTEQGILPPGVRFSAGKNGTATISGTPARSARGKTYVVKLVARNRVGTAATQRFSLRVS